jgi:FkbM family methyltransferase
MKKNSIIKKIFSSKFKRKIKEDLGVPSLHWSLENMKRLGFNPSFALDIGAHAGDWTIDFKEVFPDSDILMFEALEEKTALLQKIKESHSNTDYHIGLLSAEDGKEYSFHKDETASHVSLTSNGGNVTLKSESLDAIIERKQLKKLPDVIKIDVQGFELEVLKGGNKCLQNAACCMLEVSLLDLDGTPMVLEIMNFMDSFNFQLYDITQFMRRPYDKALFQCDFIFIKKDSPLLASKRWN